MYGYLKSPILNRDSIFFLADSDIWSVPLKGGHASRITSGLSKTESPCISPDGKWLAFTGYKEGPGEVYLMPSIGGESRRLTFTGSGSRVIGWHVDKIIFSANLSEPYYQNKLYLLDPKTKEYTKIACGPANYISFSDDGKASAIQRHGYGYVSWKRYRGGTAAELWIDDEGRSQYRLLINLDGNTHSPQIVGKRVFFISDHEGFGNVYSCNFKGQDLKRHTDSHEFYVRSFNVEGNNLVYGAGGNIFNTSLNEKSIAHKLPIELHSTMPNRQRTFADVSEYLTCSHLNKNGKKTAIISRGRPFVFGNWEGGVTQLGERDGVRYRHIAWLPDDKHLIVIKDAMGQDEIEIHTTDPMEKIKSFKNMDLGRVIDLKPSPKGDLIAITNHRCELLIIDTKSKKLKKLDRSERGEIKGISWSSDGNWITYGFPQTQHATSIKLAEIKSGKSYEITNPVLEDLYPDFDPDGRFIYFVSKRIYDPVSDSMQFEYGFPKGMKPYLITLRKDIRSPFIPAIDDSPESEKKPKLKKNAKEKLVIDLDGIKDRIIEFPVTEGRYGTILGLKNKVIYASISNKCDSDDGEISAQIKAYDLETKREDVLVDKVSWFDLSFDREWLLYQTGKKLRVIKAGEKPNNEDKSYKKGGWLELSRIKISVEPPKEWVQIFNETWRLQKEFFWTENMCNVDWDKVYDRYRPLVDLAANRDDLSDIIAEMHGELGSSHAYVFGGDMPTGKYYTQGDLGAEFSFDKKSGGWRIDKIIQGDTWSLKESSPLARPGSGVSVGDILLAINGQRLHRDLRPAELLVSQGGNVVNLLIKSGKENKTLSLKALSSTSGARYREWVNKNRDYVHKKTNGKVGYIHIPDMSTHGFSEFHRSFMTEIDKVGLIVDVRYNGGGSVSPLLLEKLSRKRLGYDQTRWFGSIPYPSDSPTGPMVALTNQYAGSDGDMFSHSFKLMNLGPLIGKRTWGGVIGIWPRHSQLVDGGYTTQPEFSFWFHDVGWSVENYGTDPDIEVEITPQDYENGVDPQLDRGIEEVLGIMKSHKEIKPPKIPNLKAPKLGVK